MAYEPKNNSGTMFKNDRKIPGGPQPDRKGEALIDGKSYWVAGWLKDGKKGQFLSLAFTPKDGPDNREMAREERDRGGVKDMKDDLPW